LLFGLLVTVMATELADLPFGLLGTITATVTGVFDAGFFAAMIICPCF
jgi:hypothetical protein